MSTISSLNGDSSPLRVEMMRTFPSHCASALGPSKPESWSSVPGIAAKCAGIRTENQAISPNSANFGTITEWTRKKLLM